MVAFLRGIANRDGICGLLGNSKGLAIAGALDEKSGRCVAGLTRVEHAFADRGCNARLKIAVCKNEIR